MSDYRTGITAESDAIKEIDKLQQQLDKFSAQSIKIKLDFDTKGIDFNKFNKTFYNLGQQAYDSYSAGFQSADSANDIFNLSKVKRKLQKKVSGSSIVLEGQVPKQIQQNNSLQNAGERF
ncbi:hypothetical protein [Qiania dongpingensis]|uniref:Uncharacterized protein n=1 Tax=Qiania dongpingensis TaxID=2763669 RepID=A0A7G9G5J8_9FIRM|nr:hypothetical protein [Qiania dongpingensis]QNM06080.1 hypothetical protein H9Q78_02645 [Qiania dongpingensis]